MNEAKGNSENVTWKLFGIFKDVPAKALPEKSRVPGLTFLRGFAERMGLISEERLQNLVNNIENSTKAILTEGPYLSESIAKSEEYKPLTYSAIDSKTDLKEAKGKAKQVEKLAFLILERISNSKINSTQYPQLSDHANAAKRAAQEAQKLYTAKQHYLEIGKSHPKIAALFNRIANKNVDLAEKAYEIYRSNTFQTNPAATKFFLLSLMNDNYEFREDVQFNEEVLALQAKELAKAEAAINALQKKEPGNLIAFHFKRLMSTPMEDKDFQDSTGKKYKLDTLISEDTKLTPSSKVNGYSESFIQAKALFKLYTKYPEHSNKLAEIYIENPYKFEELLKRSGNIFQKEHEKNLKSILDLHSDLKEKIDKKIESSANNLTKATLNSLVKKTLEPISEVKPQLGAELNSLYDKDPDTAYYLLKKLLTASLHLKEKFKELFTDPAKEGIDRQNLNEMVKEAKITSINNTISELFKSDPDHLVAYYLKEWINSSEVNERKKELIQDQAFTLYDMHKKDPELAEIFVQLLIIKPDLLILLEQWKKDPSVIETFIKKVHGNRAAHIQEKLIKAGGSQREAAITTAHDQQIKVAKERAADIASSKEAANQPFSIDEIHSITKGIGINLTLTPVSAGDSKVIYIPQQAVTDLHRNAHKTTINGQPILIEDKTSYYKKIGELIDEKVNDDGRLPTTERIVGLLTQTVLEGLLRDTTIQLHTAIHARFPGLDLENGMEFGFKQFDQLKLSFSINIEGGNLILSGTLPSCFIFSNSENKVLAIMPSRTQYITIPLSDISDYSRGENIGDNPFPHMDVKFTKATPTLLEKDNSDIAVKLCKLSNEEYVESGIGIDKKGTHFLADKAAELFLENPVFAKNFISSLLTEDGSSIKDEFQELGCYTNEDPKLLTEEKVLTHQKHMIIVNNLVEMAKKVA